MKRIFVVFFIFLLGCEVNTIEFRQFSNFCVKKSGANIFFEGMIADSFWAVSAPTFYEKDGVLEIKMSFEKPNGSNSGSFKFKQAVSPDTKIIKYAAHTILDLNTLEAVCYSFGVVNDNQ
ncbi:hypothetical protein [Microbulbifer sp. TYP-18]|uniref:hypothetical protein n=1 Tax=Microbulbifer sp. TYP-18 TaxID=3230024 RepID=UPI0034C68624